MSKRFVRIPQAIFYWHPRDRKKNLSGYKLTARELGKEDYIKETIGERPELHWGSAIFEVGDDGETLKMIEYDFDTSD